MEMFSIAAEFSMAATKGDVGENNSNIQKNIERNEKDVQKHFLKNRSDDHHQLLSYENNSFFCSNHDDRNSNLNQEEFLCQFPNILSKNDWCHPNQQLQSKCTDETMTSLYSQDSQEVREELPFKKYHHSNKEWVNEYLYRDVVMVEEEEEEREYTSETPVDHVAILLGMNHLSRSKDMIVDNRDNEVVNDSRSVESNSLKEDVEYYESVWMKRRKKKIGQFIYNKRRSQKCFGQDLSTMSHNNGYDIDDEGFIIFKEK